MATTVSATLLKKWKSIASAVEVTHSSLSPEVVTLVHRLGRSPHRVLAALRSSSTVADNQLSMKLAVRSWNASQALLDGVGGAAGEDSDDVAGATFDIYAEFDVAAVQ